MHNNGCLSRQAKELGPRFRGDDGRWRKAHFLTAIGALAALTTPPVAAQKIDRHALVTRHNITLTKVDPHAPLMLGNGNLGFTADITGLQTFPGQYSRIAPLLTMAQWSWHSFPNPNGYTEADGLVQVPVPGGGTQPYPWIRDWAELDTRPALKWLRENPHRFSLGRVALSLKRADGSQAAFTDLTNTRQTLDLWTGTLTSNFTFDGQPVAVTTNMDSATDTVIVSVASPLVASGRIGVDVAFPGVSPKINPDPSDWDNPDKHQTRVLATSPNRTLIERRLDDTLYYAQLAIERGSIAADGQHRFRAQAKGSQRLTFAIRYDRAKPSAPAPLRAEPGKAAWRNFWLKGGAIDFTGSTDLRAPELERRVVLSQYLGRINQSGDLPPQEEGLFSNSWNGKFHLEITPIHAGHWAAWGRPELLERTLGWYLKTLPRAQEVAKRHNVEGAWWTKMSGPNGWNSPSTINPFIMWQQPHPILMAELAYRAKPTPATLKRYAELVEETARLLGSWPRRDGDRYVLSGPIVPVQENHPPFTTLNPAYEVEAFRWGLIVAQQWRERSGKPRNAHWDDVIAKLAPPARRDGLYLPVESEPDFWRTTQSKECSRHAEPPLCLNRDHPSFLMAYGYIGGRVDPETMRRTLRAVEKDWDLRQTWGWDFPIVAMTAARLGERENAVDWLFRDLPNNKWGVSGMTPRVHLEAERQLVGPAAGDAGASPDGPGYARAAETYFPSNGSLLYAVAMMAAGWDGSSGHAPGFPAKGWKVRTEGIRPIP